MTDRYELRQHGKPADVIAMIVADDEVVIVVSPACWATAKMRLASRSASG
jgi:hypothetical protein